MSTTTTTAGQYFLDAVNLTPRRVTDDEDVEWLRIIRNTGRAGFSHDRAFISQEAQEAWWLEYQSRTVAYLYQDCDGFVVGFGLLRFGEGRWWSSVATLPPYTGRGYGKSMTRHIIRQSPTGVVYATARRDNPAADKLHDRRDWIVTGEDDTLKDYKTREPLP